MALSASHEFEDQVLAAIVAAIANGGLKGQEAAKPVPLGDAREIAARLLNEALAKGLPDRTGPANVTTRELTGGMSKEVVVAVSQAVSFVAKIGYDPTVFEQARAIEQLCDDGRTGRLWKHLLPAVYAKLGEGAVHAYIMEHFQTPPYWTLAELIRKSPSKAVAANHSLLSKMSDIYRASFDERLRTSPDYEYIRRIVSRLTEAEDYPAFQQMRGLVFVNGTLLPSWRDAVERTRERAGMRVPPGVWSVHGDLHARNTLVADDGTIKLIDPRQWLVGDFVGDIGKFVHFLDVELQMDEICEGAKVVRDDQTISVQLADPSPAHASLSAAWREAGAALAVEFGDTSYEERLSLASAASLLGQVPGRLRKQCELEAVIDYVHGVSLLVSGFEDQRLPSSHAEVF